MATGPDTFTACPNGNPGDAWAHDFTGYAPTITDDNPAPTPLIFCARCGEVRELVARVEASTYYPASMLEGSETR